MDINHIRAFVSVAETASFSDTARLLFITQPAVSKRIAALENTLSAQLFDRIGRKIILTEAGVRILPKCQLILSTVNDTNTIIENLAGSVSGKLSIGTSHHIGLHHIPSVLRKYTQAYPNVTLDIHFMSSEQVCEKVANGHLEIGIITLPPKIDSHLAVKALWEDQMHIVVNNTHALNQEMPCEAVDLLGHNAILPEQGTFTYSIIEKEFGRHRHELQSIIATNFLETIKMMVSVGLGWSVLPKTLIDNELVILDVPNMHFSRTLGTVQHKQRTLSNAAIAMTALLNNVASKKVASKN